MTKQPKQVKVEPDPGWRVDILIQRIIDVSMKRAVDNIIPFPRAFVRWVWTLPLWCAPQ